MCLPDKFVSPGQGVYADWRSFLLWEAVRFVCNEEQALSAGEIRKALPASKTAACRMQANPAFSAIFISGLTVLPA